MEKKVSLGSFLLSYALDCNREKRLSIGTGDSYFYGLLSLMFHEREKGAREFVA